MRHLVAIVLVGILSSACGGDDDTPLTPAPTPLPNYTGIWNGNYTFTCTQTGDFLTLNACGEVGSTTATFQLNVAQDATTNAVQGTFSLGTIPFTITSGSRVASNGSLTFGGTAFEEGVSIVVTWALTSPIVGTVNHVWTVAGATGQMTIAGTIGGASKVGSVQRAQPATAPRSLREMLNAVSGH